MKLLKNFIAVGIVMAIVFTACGVFAATTTDQLDKKYWSLQENYNKAVESGNTAGIISHGEAIMNLFIGNADPAVKAAQWKANGDLELNIMRGVLNAVAKAYEKQGDFQNAKRVYEIALPIDVAWQEVNNPDDTEFVRSSYLNKINAYDTAFSVYAEVDGNSGDTSYHGAKHEPETGVYFGECHTTEENQEKLSKAQSATLIYVRYESETIEQFDYLLKPMSESHEIIEIAWNLFNEGETLAKVLKERSKIESAADYLNKLGTPILLRFGAEMNVWQKKADPEKFKEAFKFVSRIMKERAPNVAMLWSPNWLGHVETTYEQFYPGDKYVDWVGASVYSKKYPKGQLAEEVSASIYLYDGFADPVKQIEKIVEEYGDKKPIILSECGVENYSVTRKEYTNEWAKQQMSGIYENIPMIFPQVKAILYFNTESPLNKENRFTLSDNSEILDLYKKLTAGSYFIPFGKERSDVSYKKLGEPINLPAAIVPFRAYTAYIKKDNLTITYFIDDKWVGASDKVPYRQLIDLSKFSAGKHTLKVVMTSDGRELESNSYIVNIKAAR